MMKSSSITSMSLIAIGTAFLLGLCHQQLGQALYDMFLTGLALLSAVPLWIACLVFAILSLPVLLGWLVWHLNQRCA